MLGLPNSKFNITLLKKKKIEASILPVNKIFTNGKCKQLFSQNLKNQEK